jgi:pimeloyl-ACP methyl ester carboxylesterase
MPLVQLRQVRLFYAEKGQGAPVLFLSGLSGDHAYWMGQLRALGRHYHCLAVDNRDVGQSSAASGPYTLRDVAADMADLADHLQLPPLHVIGLSMGGMVAQEFALAHPERVRSLTLASTLARADAWFRSTLEAFALLRRQVPDTPSFFEAILPWWVSHRFFEDEERITWLRWLLHQSPRSQPLDHFLRQIQAIMGHDAEERLSRITCPVLLLVGEDDSVAPVRYTRQLQQRLPQGQVVMLPGVGHAPPIENPEGFNSCLLEFLSRL